MSLVALASAKGSPGVTTLTALLAAFDPAEAVVAVEADPDGGDLGTWLGLPHHPGLVSLASASGREPGAGALRRNAHHLPGGWDLVTAPPGPRRAAAALGAGPAIAVSLREAAIAAAVYVDCGRLRPGSPAQPLLDAADLVVVVARPDPDELAHVGDVLEEVPGRAVLALVGERPYPPAEVAEVLGAELAGVLAHQPRVAESIATLRAAPRRLARTALARSAADLARALHHRLSLPAPAPPAPAPAATPTEAQGAPL